MWGREGGRGRTYEHVDGLDDVEEDLVLAVLDAFGAPRHRVRHRRRQLAVVVFLQLVVLLRYVPATKTDSFIRTY